MDELADSLEKKDAAAVRRIAHRLKGSVLCFHATKSSNDLIEIERLAEQGLLDQAAADFRKLQDHTEKLHRDLKRMTSFPSTLPERGALAP
jgi:hypothetical protein